MPAAETKLKSLLKDSVSYGLIMSFSKFAVLLLIPIYTRALTVGKYGALDTLLLIGTVLTILFLCGQDEALGRFYYDTPDHNKKQLSGTAFANIALISLLITAALFILAEPIVFFIFNSKEYIHEFRLILIYSFSTALLSFFRSLARWEFKKKIFLFLSLAPTITILAATFATVTLLDMGIRGAISAQIFANAVFTVIAFFMMRISMPAKDFIRPLLKYGAPVMLTVCLASTVNIIDKYFYIRLFGEETLGYYSIGGRYALFIGIAQSAFWIAWGPLIFSTYKDKDVKETTDKALVLFSALFGLALILQFSLAEPIITLISDATYLEGVKFALPLSFLIILEGSTNISSIGIELTKKTHLNTIITVVGIIAAVALIPVLARALSAAGIAYGLLFGKMVTVALRIVISRKLSALRFKLVLPYGVLAVSFILSFISVSMPAETGGFTVVIFRLAAVMIMSGWLAAVLFRYNIIPFPRKHAL
jgi:O-antigen/teichoic acid export membrane protein